MILRKKHRRTWAAVVAATAFSGCIHSAPLAPPAPTYSPVSFQVTPGPGFAISSASTVYLIVGGLSSEYRYVLPKLTEVVAAELRAVTPAEVILLPDIQNECPPAADWLDVCQACHVPMLNAPPSAVVVFCDLLQYDPYTPLRLGLSIRVRRAVDGAPLTSLQGTWVGAPPMPPVRRGFHWPWDRLPPPPKVEYAWTSQFEAFSATELMRNAAHDSVMTLCTGTAPVCMAMPPVTRSPTPMEAPRMEELPPAPPLPNITAPENAATGSDSSVPEESGLSP